MGVQRHLPALGCPESWVLRFPSGDANAKVGKMCFAIWPVPGRAARRVDDVTLERGHLGIDAPPEDECCAFILLLISYHIRSTLGLASLAV